jgi:hypothetical protein
VSRTLKGFRRAEIFSSWAELCPKDCQWGIIDQRGAENFNFTKAESCYGVRGIFIRRIYPP